MVRFKQRDVDPIDALIPQYVRKSDAQIQMAGQQPGAITEKLDMQGH